MTVAPIKCPGGVDEPGLLAEFGEANIPLDTVAPNYFGLSYDEARRRAPAKLPCRVFRAGRESHERWRDVVEACNLRWLRHDGGASVAS